MTGKQWHRIKSQPNRSRSTAEAEPSPVSGTSLARRKRTPQVSPQAEAPIAEFPAGTFLDAMWERLASQASISNSFRYTAHELDELADALYQVSKDEQTRLTKQDIARLGLNAVLWDYRCRGEASLLREFARRKRRPQEG